MPPELGYAAFRAFFFLVIGVAEALFLDVVAFFATRRTDVAGTVGATATADAASATA